MRVLRILVIAIHSLAILEGSAASSAGAAVAGPIAAAAVVVTDCSWLPPVDAQVIDRFRRPTNPYGPGNRGLEYDTELDQPVQAVADGRVQFVGPVGGRRYVVVAHDGNLRSTYGPLATTLVVRGQTVSAGDLLATAFAGFHLTARRGDRYLDPQPFLDGVCGRPRLVPIPAVVSARPPSDRSPIAVGALATQSGAFSARAR